MTKHTEVCITFDIEFDVNHAFEEPSIWSPVGAESVLREAKGKSQGLGFILATLAEFGIRGTFFVEVFNSYHFGDRAMGRIIETIRDAGHDVQLHQHHCWKYFQAPDWRDVMKTVRATESMAGLSLEQVADLVNEGIGLFTKLNGEKPLAFRMGGLQATPTLFEALQVNGLYVSSNIGAAIHPPDADELRLFGGIHRIGDVLEVPVLTYADISVGRKKHLKNLTITGCSYREIVDVLENAHKIGSTPVVLLTHASEFAYEKCRPTENQYSRNAINQGRFRRLCTFLAEHSGTFPTTTFAESASTWRETTSAANELVSVPLTGVIQRLVENQMVSRIRQPR